MIITDTFVQSLFEHKLFKENISQILKNNQKCSHLYQQNQISKQDFIIEQISNILSQTCSIQSVQSNQQLKIQIKKLYEEVQNIKGLLISSVQRQKQKNDLEVTCANKSKLDMSNILEQDIMPDFSEIQNMVNGMQDRINSWFGLKQQQCQDSEQAIQKGTKMEGLMLRVYKKYEQKINAYEQITEKRVQQLSKTLNNVLQMINQLNNKKLEDASSLNTNQTPPNFSQNAPNLTRQSSLQNLKIKSFFGFNSKAK